jgi:hypothetical protein
LTCSLLVLMIVGLARRNGNANAINNNTNDEQKDKAHVSPYVLDV